MQKGRCIDDPFQGDLRVVFKLVKMNNNTCQGHSQIYLMSFNDKIIEEQCFNTYQGNDSIIDILDAHCRWLQKTFALLTGPQRDIVLCLQNALLDKLKLCTRQKSYGSLL